MFNLQTRSYLLLWGHVPPYVIRIVMQIFEFFTAEHFLDHGLWTMNQQNLGTHHHYSNNTEQLSSKTKESPQ
jgi:hypothetical protein